MGGIIYDMIIEPPGIGQTVDKYGRVRPFDNKCLLQHWKQERKQKDEENINITKHLLLFHYFFL